MGKVTICGGARMIVPKLGFPEEPTEYEEIYLYTESATFTAPENGWYKVELFGAGANGTSATVSGTTMNLYDKPNAITGTNEVVQSSNKVTQGKAGKAGGKSTSIIKLKKGDTLIFVCGEAGSTSSLVINSTVDDTSYDTMYANSGTTSSTGSASGGNQSNVQGGGNLGGSGGYIALEAGTYYKKEDGEWVSVTAYKVVTNNPAGKGQAGCLKIYAGNTNAA